MAENDVNRLIDMLYERVEDAKSPALKPNLSMVDRDEVLDLLSQYEYAAIMSAHTHSNINYIHRKNGKEIFEHVTGTSCGAWWRSTVCTEGTPIGFGLYRIDGNLMEEWAYRSVRHDEQFQIRLYRASDTFVGGAKYRFKQTGADQIVANIWNWDPSWTVNVLSLIHI